MPFGKGDDPQMVPAHECCTASIDFFANGKLVSMIFGSINVLLQGW
jgi:hypothetical protein